MNRQKKFFFIIGMLALTVFLSAVQVIGIAIASPPIQPATFSYTRVSTLRPGRVWVDRDGLHIRDRVDVGVLTGDIEGLAYVDYNADLSPYLLNGSDQSSPAPGSGTAYGKIQIFASDLDLAVPIWSGDWIYQIRSGVVMSGALTALSQDGQKLLLVDTVLENRDRGIVHTGYIEFVL
jgi:hypothetical protein